MEANRTRIPGLSSDKLPAADPVAGSAVYRTLVEWLGSFWSDVYRDQDLVRALQETRADRAQQLALDLEEGLELHDREEAPVLHRERWHPVAVRRGRRNTGSRTLYRLTGETTSNPDDSSDSVPLEALGTQPATWVYDGCFVLRLGGTDAGYRGMTVYPLDASSDGIASAPACAASSPSGDAVLLGYGSDFMFLDGAVAFAAGSDPFDGAHADAFPKTEVVLPDGSSDLEATLWLRDALFDRDYVRRFLGCAVDLPAKSTEMHKKAVNAAWNALSSGAAPLLFKALVAALCGIPVVAGDGETVERVETRPDGSVLVVTTGRAYGFPPGTKLKGSVKPGARLERFDTLDASVRVYACPSDPERAAGPAGLEAFKADIPSLDLPPALFSAPLSHGFSVGWEEADVVYCGPDANGNPRIRFDMEGTESDLAVFWSSVWRRYEEAGESMEACLRGIPHGKLPPIGGTWCRISPMDFFLRNLAGANSVLVSVDGGGIAAGAPILDPGFFHAVRDVAPAYARVCVVEHSSAHPEAYGLGDVRDAASTAASESVRDEFPGGPGDSVRARWVPLCRCGEGCRRRI